MLFRVFVVVVPYRGSIRIVHYVFFENSARSQ
jgi:hypothetical protein